MAEIVSLSQCYGLPCILHVLTEYILEIQHFIDTNLSFYVQQSTQHYVVYSELHECVSNVMRRSQRK